MFTANSIDLLNITVSYFPLGLYLLILPLCFIACVVLAWKRTAWRRPIGAVLITVGILEVIPFFLVLGGSSDIRFLVPFVPLVIIFFEGCVTLVSGVAIFFASKRCAPYQQVNRD